MNLTPLLGAVPATETYSYDALYRLTAVTDGSSPVESYTYNPTGDRLSKTGTGTGLATGTYSYTPGTHQLSSIGSAPRTTDANGNTTATLSAGQSFGYGYNARNRMTIVQSGGATVGSYTYNAMGQRVRKVANAVDQRFAYDEGSHLVGEYGAAARDYIWLGDVPVAVIDTSATASTASYVHADGLNTPRAISDASGTAVWSWAYAGNAFGEQQATSGSGYPFNLRFPGQYLDAESGLNYNINRYYDPATGRYIQSDPVGLDGGQWSTYAYVGGNPLSEIDPSGLSTVTYDGNTHTVTYTRNDGTVAGTFPANNNTTRSSNGSWPNGTFNRVGSNPHPESDANGSYGSHGIITFDVPGRTGMGLHSGRADSGAQNHPTLGCVRTTDDSMETVRNLERTDPVTSINVVNNNPNAARQGTQQ
jgi:RHS repeat-associated protein